MGINYGPDSTIYAGTETGQTNAYWEAVREHVRIDQFLSEDLPVADAWGSISRDYGLRVDRDALCSRYSWTVTDPATVEFVRRHAGQHVIDPLAGSGWWAWLLEQGGAEVRATDLNPPGGDDANHWHRETETHVAILKADAAAAAAVATGTLLLSWPPYESDAGERTIRAYGGGRIIYIGESDGGCCGTSAMFELLESEWREIATHRPIQYFGIRDWVTVYERAAAS